MDYKLIYSSGRAGLASLFLTIMKGGSQPSTQEATAIEPTSKQPKISRRDDPDRSGETHRLKKSEHGSWHKIGSLNL